MPIKFIWGGEDLRRLRLPGGRRSHFAEQYNDLVRLARVNKMIGIEIDRDVLTDMHFTTIQSDAHRVCGDECAEAFEVRAALTKYDKRMHELRFVMLVEDVVDYARMSRAWPTPTEKYEA